MKVNGAQSEALAMLSDIPQGMVLGSLLFIVYIKDILDNVESEGLLFADDTKIYCAITSKEDAHLSNLISTHWKNGQMNGYFGFSRINATY